MADAWMVRGAERQEFQQKVQRQLYDLEEETEGWGDHWREGFAYLAGHIIFYLQQGGKVCDHKSGLRHEIAARGFFRKTLLPALEKFSRAPEEANYLLAELVLWLTTSALSEYQRALMIVEMMNPQLIFHAHSATADVPVEG